MGVLAFRDPILSNNSIDRLPAGSDVKIEVKRKEGGKTETVAMKLVSLPDVIPEVQGLPTES